MELTVEQVLLRGVSAHKEGKLQDAERYYRAILQSQPNHPDANHNLGVLAVSVGMINDALPLFNKALNANPKVAQFWLSYIEALIKLDKIREAKELLIQSEKYIVDVSEFKGIDHKLKLISKFAEDKFSKTPEQINESKQLEQQINSLLSFFQNGKFADAEVLATYLTKEYPNHQFAWKILGAVLWKTGKKAAAITANQKAITLAPNDFEAQNNLGNMLKDLGKLSEAEESCRKAISLKPDFAEAHNNLGNTLNEQGRLLESEESYRNALKFKPDFVETHNNLGAILQKQGRFNEAEASYLQAIKLKVDYAQAYNNLGNLFQEQGRFEEAGRNYKQAITFKPNYADAHNNLGVTQQALGNLVDAEASYINAIALNPGFAKAHNNFGVLLQELGRLEEAEEKYRQAIALNPDYSKAGIQMLNCLYQSDKKLLFFNQLEHLIAQDKANSVIGSLTSRSALRYGEVKQNIFCNDPLKHVLLVDLQSRYDFEEIFSVNAKKILLADKGSKRRQPLLSMGYQTSGNLFDIEINFTGQIQKIIRLEIEKYRANFESIGDVFIKKWPVDYDLYGWLISMKSGGELQPHIHENGWLSGSIYINVPAKTTFDSGSLVVALGKDSDAIDPSQNLKKVLDVTTGTMALFPASLMHYTIPFESSDDRIVLAFDVIPKS